MKNIEGKIILIIDDQKSVRKTMAIALEDAGCDVYTAENGVEGRMIMEGHKLDAVIVDLRLPDCDGIELLQYAKEKHPGAVVLLITGHGTIESAVEAVKKGAYHYVLKPIDFEYLKILLSEAFEKTRLLEENIQLKKELGGRGVKNGIIGSSPRMKEVLELVALAGDSDSSVLVTGETGTGKELVADAIHYNSSRAQAGIMRINCAALPESLLESELFGHEKGAFTDARSRKRGIFELADGGTILFDEIGCMTPQTQARLLRVLEDRKVRRIGGEKFFSVDVRIIAATNDDLEKKIADESFRSDLFYRLNVLNIHVPPLRDRADDIPLLVDHFIGKHRPEANGTPIRLTPAVMDILLAHNWPGNVRELENIIQRAFIFKIDDVIDIQHLPRNMSESTPCDCAKEIPVGDMTYKEYTRELVYQTLKKVDGNKTRAAEILGVSREFIRRHLK